MSPDTTGFAGVTNVPEIRTSLCSLLGRQGLEWLRHTGGPPVILIFEGNPYDHFSVRYTLAHTLIDSVLDDSSGRGKCSNVTGPVGAGRQNFWLLILALFLTSC